MRRPPLWWRFSVIFLGILILIWLPVEDRSTIGVLIFSILICASGALAARDARPGSRQGQGEQDASPRPRKSQFTVLSTSLIAGLGVTAVALLLMAIKTGLHGHGTPDYTPEQMVRVLSLTPLWVVVGLVIGLITFFWQK